MRNNLQFTLAPATLNPLEPITCNKYIMDRLKPWIDLNSSFLDEKNVPLLEPPHQTLKGFNEMVSVSCSVDFPMAISIYPSASPY